MNPSGINYRPLKGADALKPLHEMETIGSSAN